MKMYCADEGFFDRDEAFSEVYVLHDGVRCGLAPRLDLANHSPTGFAWGYAGSGPSQLALAILADALGDDRRALKYYQAFKVAALAKLEQDSGFTITHAEVLRTVLQIEREREEDEAALAALEDEEDAEHEREEDYALEQGDD